MNVVWINILSVFPAAFPNQAKEAEEGDDVFLECQTDHQVDVSTSPVTWSKDDPRNIVHVYVRGRDRADDQKAAFKNRTVLFHEGLRKGNVTLQLSTVQLSDSGTFMCYIRRPETYCYTALRVGKYTEVSDELLLRITISKMLNMLYSFVSCKSEERPTQETTGECFQHNTTSAGGRAQTRWWSW